MERAEEIITLCNERGWKVTIGIEPDKPEDISDIERLLNPPAPIRAEPRVGRNDPCPCGSGLKFKKCCLKKDDQNPHYRSRSKHSLNGIIT